MIPDRLAAALADRYRLERELGQGGMATVYLADDLRHKRRVAIKVLRPELSAVIGAARFLSEIETTANLQHPHILPLFDSGEVDGTAFYVMPYVEGESLRDRLGRDKQLPIAEATRLAGEVASALDYAHRQGIIHRDIKPENVLLHDGRALVADFGIALAASRAEGASRMTETGMSLGTPHYMSPEQAMGERDLDARSDVYALGAMTYEMLAGEPPFTGPTAQAIVAKVMTAEPEPVTSYRKTVPPHVAAAVATALQKLPADRFPTAAAFGEALTNATYRGAGAGTVRQSASPPVRHAVPALAAVALLATIAAAWGWLRQPVGATSAELPPTRLALPIQNLGGSSTAPQRQVAITPDGSTVLYTAIGEAGANQVMRHVLADGEPAPVAGVEPFTAGLSVAPDGRHFFGRTLLGPMYIYPVGGGSGRPLPSSITSTNEVAWAPDGSLYIGARRDVDRGMALVAPDGAVTRPFGSQHTSLQPHAVLPNGRTMITVRQQFGANAGPVVLMDIPSGTARLLIDRPIVDALYTSGYLVYVLQGGGLEAVAFDADRGEVTGSPVQLAEGVAISGTGSSQFDVSANGTVVYMPEEPRSLVLLDRTGAVRSATTERRNWHAPVFSPDGRRIAVDFSSPDGRDVWIVDRTDGTITRATFDRTGHDPTWSPDGRSIMYTAFADSGLALKRIALGASTAESLAAPSKLGWTGEWLPDGSALVTVATSLTEGSDADIAVVRNAGRGPLDPLIATRFTESFPAVSPDGRWLAWTSNQGSEEQVFVRRLDGTGGQLQVSRGAANEPVWSGNGRELFYRSYTGPEPMLEAAALAFDPELRVVSRTPLFPVGDVATATPHSNYDVSPDGQTFVMVRFNPASRLVILQNLPALVRRLEGAGR